MRPSISHSNYFSLSSSSSSLSHRHPVSRKHSLLPRINLINHILRRVRVPRIAHIVNDRREDPLLQQGGLLNRVDIQTTTDVPGDMAMEGPGAWVVGVVLQHNVRGGTVGLGALDKLGVAALGVGSVGNGLAVPFAVTFGEDVEIVAVQMHGVGGDEVVVDDEADGGVGAKVINVPFGGIGEVARVGEGEDGVASGGCQFCVRSL